MDTAQQSEHTIRAFKGKSFLPALTVYDYPMTRLLDELGIPLLLVGDSLGMVVLGYPDTTHVTMEEMLHHVRAAARANPRGFLVADMPYQSYQNPDQALTHATQLKEAGAKGVKLEGGQEVAPQIQAILQSGIPCVGHLGMLPQRVVEEGGYRIKGRSEQEKASLLENAELLAKLGVCALVLELVQSDLAREITHRVSIPTIGIGSGDDCDGQILVTQDLIGGFPWFRPKFVTPVMESASLLQKSVDAWRGEQSERYRKAFSPSPTVAHHRT
ncbi:MAG: 3-methyl-2-oxobutanoate hydroxymethyltransferase [Limisphaerales bacterium]